MLQNSKQKKEDKISNFAASVVGYFSYLYPTVVVRTLRTPNFSTSVEPKYTDLEAKIHRFGGQKVNVML